MSSEGPVSDDSISESRACVLASYHSISFSLEGSLLPLSFSECLGMIQQFLVSTVLISPLEIGISVAAMLSEMEPTGRSHSDNNSTLFSPLYSSPTFFFPYKLYFDFIPILPLAASYFLCLSSICLSVTKVLFFSSIFLGSLET